MKLKISIVTFALVVAAGAAACFAQDSHIQDHKGLIGRASSGKQAYRRYCVGCHGPEGDGNGENATWIDPKPRDFTAAVFKCRSTPTGMLPTDDDMFQAIGRGFVDTNMPAWLPLTNHDRADLVAYIKTFSNRWKDEPAAKPISIPTEPPVTSSSILKGREVYQKMECWKCHGSAGRGDGPSAATLTDSKDNPLRPYNFAVGSRFKCGQTNQDLYRIFMTGLDGTPMPSFADNIKPEDAWDLVHFLRTLQPMHTLEAKTWKEWTATHSEEAKALKPLGPARLESDLSSGSSAAAPNVDAITEKSNVNVEKAEGTSTQAAPQSSNTAVPETRTNGARPPEPQLTSKLSSGDSGTAPIGDAFVQKSKAEEVEGASTHGAPQSPKTAAPATAETNITTPLAPKAPAVDAPLRKSLLPRGTLILQVAAFAQEANAHKLVESLRQKNFPAFLSTTDKEGGFYRVQVGPYADEESARTALSELGSAGFKPFILSADSGGIDRAGN
jgi:mono/diheme cytochrome c family protein/cell division septation protein DedD